MAIITTRSNDAYALELSSNKDNGFTYTWASALIDYLDDLSDDIGENIEFDQVAIRCDYSEYTKDEILREYTYLIDSYIEDYEGDKDDEFEAILEELRGNTTLLEVDENTYIIKD